MYSSLSHIDWWMRMICFIYIYIQKKKIIDLENDCWLTRWFGNCLTQITVQSEKKCEILLLLTAVGQESMTFVLCRAAAVFQPEDIRELYSMYTTHVNSFEATVYLCICLNRNKHNRHGYHRMSRTTLLDMCNAKASSHKRTMDVRLLKDKD